MTDTETLLQKVESELKFKINNFSTFIDGFSFTVADELSAYKAAYAYRGTKNVVVKFLPHLSQWHVGIYLHHNLF